LNASILGMTGKEIDARFDEIVEFTELGEFMETPVKRYSSGMYMRLGFSVAVHSDPDILLVDEVLAVGDAVFAEKCLDKIREFQRRGVTIVIVSHSLETVQQFCDRALLLHDHRLVLDGSPAAVTERYMQIVHPSEMAPAPEPSPAVLN
jgi:ABC-type polysaccharide/polyol phosphate transport system ATPase subunit